MTRRTIVVGPGRSSCLRAMSRIAQERVDSGESVAQTDFLLVWKPDQTRGMTIADGDHVAFCADWSIVPDLLDGLNRATRGSYWSRHEL